MIITLALLIVVAIAIGIAGELASYRSHKGD